MKTLHILFTVLVLSILSVSLSCAQSNRETAEQSLKKLKKFYEVGVFTHQNYNLKNISELRECVGNNRQIRNEAKEFPKEVRALLGTAFYSYDIAIAADAAMSCVYCGGDGSACETILIGINDLEQRLKE